MAETISYIGTRWHKCDLHLHTPASNCFQDKNVTPQQFISKALERELSCIAITDHNTGAWINQIKDAATGTGLTVFPGVEITCDTSKVHLLVLFEIDRTMTDIEDFLIKCSIDRINFGAQTTNSPKTILEIAKIANTLGGLVIPAHIDEYNGLGSIGDSSLHEFFSLPSLNAVQVVHKEFLDKSLKVRGNPDLHAIINSYYPTSPSKIDESKISEWCKPVKKALENNLAITTFSDNPHEPNNSKHGLDGIGTIYTWIKMEEQPSLEGLRQAFLMPGDRVRNIFQSSRNPYTPPKLWIKSVKILDSTITDESNPLIICFNPQLTTIIGGRGSGKSSILRFLRGVFSMESDLTNLKDVYKDFKEFYTKYDPKSQLGVISENTQIEVEFVRNNSLFRIVSKNIVDVSNQTIEIFKYNSETDTWTAQMDEGLIDYFLFEQYSQKQIYEIAQVPNSLRDRIDKSSGDLLDLLEKKELVRKQFLENASSFRTLIQQTRNKGKLQTALKDVVDQINVYQKSGFTSLLSATNDFSTQDELLNSFVTQMEEKENLLIKTIEKFELNEVGYSFFAEKHAEEIKLLSNNIIGGYAALNEQLNHILLSARNLREQFNSALETSNWKKEFVANKHHFEIEKSELEKIGISDLSDFEALLDQKSEIEKELERIATLEETVDSELDQKIKYQADYVKIAKSISDERRRIVSTKMSDEKVRTEIKKFRNKNDFENKIRKVIDRESGFDNDIEELVKVCFSGDVENNLPTIRKLFYDQRDGNKVENISGHFKNLVKSMKDSQLDEIDLLVPEDEIEIEYKPSGSGSFKKLSSASAGQKTTAILTLILSQGDVPLILDQPEDDLDNRLVYELIVDRLRQAKENRQIIVVTHNANIPVNGDSEYIISMDSESKKLSVCQEGTIEQISIKKEICDIMEGGEQAFKMRSEKYKNL